MFGRPAHFRDESGFTLVEVLVAMIVLGIGVSALLGALGMNAKTTFANRNQSAAQSLLNATAEYVKGLPWGKFSPNCGPSAATTIDTEIPHDSSFVITYGPAQPPSAQTPPLSSFGSSDSTCQTLAIVPVTVDNASSGYHFTVNVLRRPPDNS